MTNEVGIIKRESASPPKSEVRRQTDPHLLGNITTVRHSLLLAITFTAGCGKGWAQEPTPSAAGIIVPQEPAKTVAEKVLSVLKWGRPQETAVSALECENVRPPAFLRQFEDILVTEEVATWLAEKKLPQWQEQWTERKMNHERIVKDPYISDDERARRLEELDRGDDNIIHNMEGIRQRMWRKRVGALAQAPQEKGDEVKRQYRFRVKWDTETSKWMIEEE